MTETDCGGQRSNADFFVNGIRDDVQYYRDLYNIQRIEVLTGSRPERSASPRRSTGSPGRGSARA
jgi:outer membrane receptor for monomeric catechols